LVCLIEDGSFLTKCSITWSRRMEICSVGQPQADTMGLAGLLGLGILGRKYKTGVREVVFKRLSEVGGRSPLEMRL